MPTSLIAPLIGGAIGAAGSIFGGNAAADASKQAAKLQQQRFNQSVGYQQPYLDAGTNALKAYSDSLGLNGSGPQQSYFSNFQTDPYYQGQLTAGTKAITNSAAARGTLYGGNTLRAVNDYGANLLKSAYDTRSNQLAGVAGSGQNAANALTTAATTNGVYQGNSIQNAGYYTGAGFANAGNALAQGFQNFNKANPNFFSNMFKPSGYDPTWGSTYISNGVA